MISLQTVEKYCQEYWKIENYDQAVADETQTWQCHHRHEIDWALPREELIAIGRYYDVHYSELIFLTPEEHVRLHHQGKEGYWKGKEGYWKGQKGENAPNYKYHITEEELYDLYVVKGFTKKHIAELLGCSPECIKSKLKKYNIKKSTSKNTLSKKA